GRGVVGRRLGGLLRGRLRGGSRRRRLVLAATERGPRNDEDDEDEDRGEDLVPGEPALLLRGLGRGGGARGGGGARAVRGGVAVGVVHRVLLGVGRVTTSELDRAPSPHRPTAYRSPADRPGLRGATLAGRRCRRGPAVNTVCPW